MSEKTKEKAICQGGECVYGKTVCCYECEEWLECDEKCDGGEADIDTEKETCEYFVK